MDKPKSIKKRYEDFRKLYMANFVKYRNPEGEILTVKNVPVVLVSEEYFIIFNKNSVSVIKWDYFISIEHRLDERQMSMAVRTAEAIESDMKMFNRDKPTHDMGVG